MSVKDQSKRKRGLSIDQSLYIEQKYKLDHSVKRKKEINSAESCQLDGDVHELFMVVVPAF